MPGDVVVKKNLSEVSMFLKKKKLSKFQFRKFKFSLREESKVMEKEGGERGVKGEIRSTALFEWLLQYNFKLQSYIDWYIFQLYRHQTDATILFFFQFSTIIFIPYEPEAEVHLLFLGVLDLRSPSI